MRPGREPVLDALGVFARGTRKYFGVATIFGGIVAVLDGAALLILGIPAAGLWALLAFVTNYIPNIGFIIGLIPPAILGLLVGGPSLMIAVIVVYCVLNFIIQSVLQPKFVGDAVGLTTTVSFLSLIVWAYILGPIGAILAIPASLLFKALLVDMDPRAMAGTVPGRQAGVQGQQAKEHFQEGQDRRQAQGVGGSPDRPRPRNSRDSSRRRMSLTTRRSRRRRSRSDDMKRGSAAHTAMAGIRVAAGLPAGLGSGGVVIAGLTVWAVLVPEALAYATIAGVPPVVGLYAAIPSLVLYAAAGSSRHLVVGPMSATAALSAASVAPRRR